MQITDHTEIGDLEDRCRGIPIDRHDRFRPLHSRSVPHRTGNSQRDIKPRMHDRPHLVDLPVPGTPAVRRPR
jgi:hypothetical protein